jgi:hypothetical protein
MIRDGLDPKKYDEASVLERRCIDPLAQGMIYLFQRISRPLVRMFRSVQRQLAEDSLYVVSIVDNGEQRGFQRYYSKMCSPHYLTLVEKVCGETSVMGRDNIKYLIYLG